MKYKNSAEEMKLARKVSGVSQNQLAHKLGFGNGQFISNIERGICPIPAEYVKKICKMTNWKEHKFIDAHLADVRNNYVKEMK